MTKLIPLMAVLLLSGCSTLHGKVLSDIHNGDSKDHVVDVLGQPDQFRTVEETVIYRYSKKADICTIWLREEKVTQTACETDPNYRSFGARFAKGFSDGYNANNSRSVSCTSTNMGYQTQTNCQ